MVWDARTGKLKTSWDGRHGEINGLAISPDGRLVATACAAHLARHPADIPALFRLGPAAATAGRALRSGVRDLLVRLGPA